jgi:hypothetical protein
MAQRRHLVIAVSLATLCVVQAGAQVGGSATMAPVNDPPNPYETIAGWAKMPEGRTWGSTSAVEIDKDGVSIEPAGHPQVRRQREPREIVRGRHSELPARYSRRS